MVSRTDRSELRYLASRAVDLVPALVTSRIRRALGRSADRTPTKVRANYDTIRARRQVGGFEHYVFGDPDVRDYVLQDDRVRWATPAQVRRLFLARLEAVAAEYVRGARRPVVVEFGSGSGRNALYLKHRFPHIQVIGLELSAVSVELSKQAASEFRLDVEFTQADVTEPLPTLPDEVTLCYSVHALEQMPRIFDRAVEAMLSLRPEAVVFFEPVGELYPWSLRGLLSRVRLARLDYLRGFYRYLVKQRLPIARAGRLGFAGNPLNETVEILIERASRPVPAS